MTDWDDQQVEDWHRLHEQVARRLALYGTEHYQDWGDYFLVDDNYGWRRITIAVQNLKMFAPEIVEGLRALLQGFPQWEIVAYADVPGKKNVWPVMGLTIRKHEIIDGLQRQYFPEEFKNFVYADSRPGTGYD